MKSPIRSLMTFYQVFFVDSFSSSVDKFVGAYAWMTVTSHFSMSCKSCSDYSIIYIFPTNKCLGCYAMQEYITPLLCEFWFPKKRIVVPSLAVQPFPVHITSEIPRMSNLQLFISSLLCLATLMHCAYVPCCNFCCCFKFSGFGRPFGFDPNPSSILLQMDCSPRCNKFRFCWLIMISVV